MSLTDKNQKCAVCTAYLFPEDDIVYCPVCGAPHHRDCYNSIGKCGFDELHGTDLQYKKPEEAKEKQPESETPPTPPITQTCQGCGMDIERGARYCNNCGMPVGMSGGMGGAPFVFNPFEQSAPIKEETPIADGVTVKDAAKIVKSNSFRYIPKFLKLSKENKRSWNWAAFLLPHGWFGFRKMYKESIITSILTIVSVILNFPLSIAVAQLPLADESIRNYVQLAEYYTQFLGDIGTLPILLSFIGLALGLIIRIVCGIYGDYIYKQRVILSAELVKNAEDTEAAEEKFSGTSFFGFFLAVCAVEFIPTLLSVILL